MDFIQQIVTQCEDLQAPILLELDQYWLISPNVNQALSETGYYIARVQSSIEGTETFFDALQEAIDFPYWFGFDRGTDIPNSWYNGWQPKSGYIIVFEEPVLLQYRSHTFFLNNIRNNMQLQAYPGNVPFKVLIPKIEQQEIYSHQAQDVEHLNYIHQIVAQCEDLEASVVLELDSQWLTSPLLDEALRAKAYFVPRVQSKINGDKELFSALDKACHFPTWFGFNWDALNDILSYFESHPAPGYVIIFEQPIVLSPRSQGFLEDIFEMKRQQWQRYNIVFKVLMLKNQLDSARNGNSPTPE